jgi:anchored repeat ABC transporter substrate-binding protein
MIFGNSGNAHGLRSRLRRCLAALVSAAVLLPLAACSDFDSSNPHNGKLNVVTTTGILKDLVSNVAGDKANVSAIVPDNADPHSYEPSLRKIRDIVYADVAFSNYMLLEEHSIIKALDANLRPGVPDVGLAESSVKHAAEVIPLVEDVSLDTVWLGLAVQGAGEQYGAKRSSEVELTATGMQGPGQLTAYLTGSFGDVSVYFNSADGFDGKDKVSLPTEAHTHLSWGFSKPGVYKLGLKARLKVSDDAPPITLGSTTMVFAVGVNSQTVAKKLGATKVLDEGHADLAVDMDKGGFIYRADNEQKSSATHLQRDYYAPKDVVVEVPNKALHEIPAGGEYRFLGNPRDQIYLLPQAVLGSHVHGDIDPHLWQNVRNGIAYVQTIADKLAQVDPKNAAYYHQRATAYTDKLAGVDDYVRKTINQIPPSRRLLVTTHDAFAYLGQAYGVKIAGFVTPNPATEPSLADRKKLTQTIRNLKVPAVFLEPNLRSRSSVLQQVADENHIRVCPIYGDTFDGKVNTYIDMMRYNANILKECLS